MTSRSFAIYDNDATSEQEPLIFVKMAIDGGTALLTLTALNGEQTTILATKSTNAVDFLCTLFAGITAIVA